MNKTGGTKWFLAGKRGMQGSLNSALNMTENRCADFLSMPGNMMLIERRIFLFGRFRVLYQVDS
jgi:hypothetical protein